MKELFELVGGTRTDGHGHRALGPMADWARMLSKKVASMLVFIQHAQCRQ